MRYLLFSGECYYAKGGGNDFICASDDIIELIHHKDINEDWYHVFDTKTLKILAGSKYQAYGADDLEGSQILSDWPSGGESE